MSDRGILTSVHEKKLADIIDNAIKMKGIFELVDGYVFKVLITFVDDAYADKLSVEIKEKLATLADALLLGNWDAAEDTATDIINKLIDIPGLDEAAEGLLFKGIIEFIIGAVLKYIGEKKGTVITLDLAR